MTLNYEEEIEVSLDFDPQKLAEQVVEAVLDDLDCPYEAEVSLLITGPDEVQELNKRFRDKDQTTDVLSFPMNDFETEGVFDFLEEQDDAFNPETGELLLGDIVINEQRVFSQAEEYGHSTKREFAFLVAHSMLHLCGFDHMEPEEAKRMERRQADILDKMGITR